MINLLGKCLKVLGLVQKRGVLGKKGENMMTGIGKEAKRGTTRQEKNTSERGCDGDPVDSSLVLHS